MKKIISVLVVLGLLLTSLISMAAPINQLENVENTIIIKGNVNKDSLEEDFSKTSVILLVLNKGYTAENLKELLALDDTQVTSQIFDMVCYLDETLANSEGDYTFKFIMDSKYTSGEYVVFAGCNGFGDLGSGISNAASGKVVYVPTAQKIIAVEKFNESIDKSLEDLTEKISLYNLELMISTFSDGMTELYEKVKEQEKFFTIMKNFGKYNTEQATINESLLAIHSNIKKAIVLQGIEKEDDLELLYNLLNTYKDIIEFDISIITDNIKNEILTSISLKENIINNEIITLTVKDAVVETNIIKASKWGDIKKVLKDNQEYLGINFNDKNCNYDEVCHKMYKILNTLTTKQQIIDTFNKFVLQTPIDKEPDNTGTGGGGSSSGTGGGGIAPPISITPKPDQEKPKEQEEIKYSDVPDDFWGATYINELSKLGIMKGKSDTEFAPMDNITREEFIAVIIRGLKFDIIESDVKFSDVDDNAWYSSYIKTAKELYIINGRPDNTFGVNENITREDMAVIAYNAMKLKSIEKEKSQIDDFKDLNDISHYAIPAVKSLHEAGILNGSGNLFSPKNNTTRAECAKIIYMILQ